MIPGARPEDKQNSRARRLFLSALQLDRALRLVWESSAKWTLAGFALLLVQGTIPLLSLYLMKLIVDSVAAGSAASASAQTAQADFGRVLLLISLAAVLALLAAVSRSASSVANEAQVGMVSDHVQDMLHAKSVQVDLEYYENSGYYDSLHRAQQEAPFRPARIVNGLAQLVQSSISLLAVLGLLVSFNWAIAAVLLAAAIPGVFIRLKYADRLYQWQLGATTRERKALYLHWLLTGDGHAKEVRLFALGGLLMDRYHDLRKDLREERLKITYQRSAADLLAQICIVLALFGSFAYIANRAFQGSITLGDLVMYFGAFQQGQGFMQSLLLSLSSLYEDNLFLTSFYEFLDLEPGVKEPSSPRVVPGKIKQGISLEHVSFRYPGSAAMVLDDISLHIPSGQSLALVGENGSGKTTLIKLLCRLYDPSQGRIALDGIDIREFKTSDLRRLMSVVFQDYVRYNLTAKENIWFGQADSSAEMDSIVRAAKCSGADEVVEALPQGYDTVLGKWFEDGTQLSIGEWQKIALARSFLREAQVIVLDEPTSSLDARAEDEVFARFRELTRGRTSILISHRLSTTRTADHICFLKEGKIAEQGTHEELMDLQGEYAGLYEIQARRYR